MSIIYSNIAPCIDLFSNVFRSDWLISGIEEECATQDGEMYWDVSFTGNGVNSSYRTSLSCSLDPVLTPTRNHRFGKKTYDEIITRTRMCVDSYGFIYRVPISLSESYVVLKYQDGAQYRTHFDDSPLLENRRTVSMVAGLSGEFSGGELHFPFFDIEVKLGEGDVLVFPSSYAYSHYAKPVLSGTKYSMVTWFK
jgi:hypothetical protein